jgi:putative inorganic carbon (HCO3(-)) transporter
MTQRRTRIAATVLLVLAVVAVAWGVFALAAVYPWGYWPLIVLSSAVGVGALFLPGRSNARVSWLGVALLATGMAIGLQLLPLPASALASFSPARHALIQQYDMAYLLAPNPWHPTSISPAATQLALVCFAAFAVLMLGTTRLLSASGARATLAGVTLVGLALALVGIIQNMTFAGKIYGLWPHPFENKPFGPFVNKNNFAGWMLMALPLSLGYLGATVAKGLRHAGKGWRNRVLWLSSREGGQAVMIGAAAFAMGTSLVMTMSRSGMVALVLALGLTAWAVARRRGSRFGGGVVLAGSVLFVASLVYVIGPQVLANRFADRTAATMAGRFGAWQDALSIFSRFPIVGAGINTFPVAMLFYQTHDLQNYWSEAHNDFVQILAEGGVLVAACALVALVVFVGAIRHRFAHDSERRSGYWIRVGATAGLLAIGIQELVEFSLQIPANACLFALVAAVALHDRDPATRGAGMRRSRMTPRREAHR